MTNEQLEQTVRKECEDIINGVNSPNKLCEYYYLDVARGIYIRDWICDYLLDYAKDEGTTAEKIVEFLKGFKRPLHQVLQIYKDTDGVDLWEYIEDAVVRNMENKNDD